MGHYRENVPQVLGLVSLIDDSAGVETGFSNGHGLTTGFGVGCSVMFNFYW
jgi:hypothetical protein